MEKMSERKSAKLCYEHIGGKLGSLLLEQFVVNGWLAKNEMKDKHFHITEKGTQEFSKLGIDLTKLS
jgi:predicted transcriptional regulator